MFLCQVHATRYHLKCFLHLRFLPELKRFHADIVHWQNRHQRVSVCIETTHRVVISLDSGLSSNWWYPHLRSNLLKTFEPFIVCNTSSTVGIGYRLLMIAWFACLMSMYRRISPLFFGTISTGLTQGAGPSTG